MCDSDKTIPAEFRSYSRRPVAFTLIELLVVVAIIGVLAGIAFPMIGSATQTARATKCLSNLRQLGAGAFLYAADHDGTLPDDGSAADGSNGDNGGGILYQQLLWPYLYPTKYPGLSGPAEPPGFIGTVFQCPQAARDPQTAAIPITNIRSYAMNYYMGDGDGNTGEKTSRIPHPATTAMFCDNYNGSKATEPTLAPRHRGLCNVVFCDGHSTPVKLTDSIRGVGGAGYHKDPFWGDLKQNPNQ